MFTNAKPFKLIIDGQITTVLMIYKNAERKENEKAVGWVKTTDGVNVSVEMFGVRVAYDENAAKAAVLATHKDPMVVPLTRK